MVIDGRTLSHETSEKIRKMAVQRVRDGERPSEVIKSYGMCRTTIYRWLQAAKKGGLRRLDASKHPGPKTKLTARQKRSVAQWTNGKDPRHFGFESALWTRKIIGQLIEQKFGLRLCLNSVGRLLLELGITPQKPLRRAYERDPIEIEKWKTETFPKIKRRAKRRCAQIFFLDETGVRSDSTLGRTWGRRGEKQEVSTSGRRQSVNAISAVTAQGAFWYQVYTGRLNASRFISFLKHFRRGRRKPVFIILDGHPVHRAKAVSAYVKSLKGQLELHFLPGYAPELNPDEFVWNYLKREGASKRPLKKGETLRAGVENDLAKLKRKPSLLRKFFCAESVSYTTA